MSLAIISHPDCLLHDAGFDHPERPERIKVIQDVLVQFPFHTKVAFHHAPFVSYEQLIATHDKNYVDWIIREAPKDEVIAIDADTWMNPHTLDAAKRAAGAACFAVDLLMRNDAKVAFCNVRPPGHHAEFDKAMGFCLFNNVAIAAKHAMQQYQLERIAIVDFDVHHGNGTQNIFQKDKRVLYCSSFEYPFYPGYDEEMDNEHILSVPLPAGTTGEDYQKAVEAKWFEAIDAFKPQLIFFSAGFDAHASDPLADLLLTKDDYVWLTKQIKKIADKHCDGKLISVLEGGYNLQALAECAPLHVQAMV